MGEEVIEARQGRKRRNGVSIQGVVYEEGGEI